MTLAMDKYWIGLLFLWVSPALLLNNGLVRTPPMGWLDWERFRCNTDCKDDPEVCIGERLFMKMADRLVQDGWKDLGYVFVNIDNCWSLPQRDKNGKLVADPARFPNGMKKLADYMHDRGLKLGIYGNCGSRTCGGGYPGSLGYEKVDAETFAEWGVDMLKYDGCNSNETEKSVGYPAMGMELNATGRHIVYSCSWPAYDGGLPPKVNYTFLGEICNMWRNYWDLDDTFVKVERTINWWGDNQDVLIPAAGPGGWNDPDTLIAGDFALSYDQCKLQFGMWAMLAAPLLMSNDLTQLEPRIKEVLQNQKIIEINQDPLGIQGRRVKGSDMQIWVRPLINQQQAIAIISFRTDGSPMPFSFRMADLGIKNPTKKYVLQDLYDTQKPRVTEVEEEITVLVNPSGIVMYRAVPTFPRKSAMEIELLEIDLL